MPNQEDKSNCGSFGGWDYSKISIYCNYDVLGSHVLKCQKSKHEKNQEANLALTQDDEHALLMVKKIWFC